MPNTSMLNHTQTDKKREQHNSHLSKQKKMTTIKKPHSRGVYTAYVYNVLS